ncbi:N-acyl homoserine lactonase family protein [Rhodococcus erythropolis]|uniref:N-acyl homoserine lactonase family protein n=1 Tax=Rhodococcus erythropolis TaxID=1833 RepID=UPI003013E8F0
MKVHVLDGGRIRLRKWELFDPSLEQGEERWLSNPCYLIEHAVGTLLWDTGLPDFARTHESGFPVGDIAVFHVSRSLKDQLTEIGRPPESIDFVALSHMHSDHVGNLGLFKTSRLLVQSDEYAIAFGENAAASGLDPASYTPARTMKVVDYLGDLDVFGDGSVVVKRFPGHTPGSQALLLRLPETGAVLLSGDLAHSRANWSNRTVPVGNVDAAQTVKSLDAADELCRRENATVWVQHDLDQYEQIVDKSTTYR